MTARTKHHAALATLILATALHCNASDVSDAQAAAPRASSKPAATQAVSATAKRGEPDYSAWTALLRKYYNEQRGMNYRALKATDMPALQQLRQQLARVDVASLDRPAQLAYWINLYNVNVAAIVAEKYPVKSIRDLSTDPIRRLNIFDRELVPFGNGKISLNDIEHERIRKGFKDPRIHFAINCAAASCPPIRGEGAFTGANLSAQLDDQTRKFLNGPNGATVSKKNGTAIVRTTKIMDWFGEDFDQWGGGRIPFIKKYLTGERRAMLDS
ncbi:MAG TPA: DUF547 domain-containing protein, partial [Thermoanaerobaculia bacterium]|nr:DUF547 domain-containing protein [Thermoanaerobaculia bacterium]